MVSRSAAPAVVRNDYAALHPAPLGSDWQPRLRVSVVVPAYADQEKLDVTLASLAAQSYPGGLTEVVVVDDGSQPPLHLPDLRPEQTRLVRVESGWGIANATSTGVAAADGDVVLRLDSDMLVFRDHVEAHLRWHHVSDHVVVLGAKLFVDVAAGLPDPAQVRSAVADGRAGDLFDVAQSHPHEWIERVLGRTDDLRAASWEAHRISVGASISLTRALHDSTGGMHAHLRLGSDSEFGYRLSQAGAVFVYDRAAQAWHLGISSVMKDRPAALRYRLPFVVGDMARPRYRRPGAGHQYPVPYTEVVVEVAGANGADVVGTVDGVLDSDDADLVVSLDVTGVPAGVRATLAADYASEPRVCLRDPLAPTAYPSPFRVRVRPGVRLGPAALTDLVAKADRVDVGLLVVAGDRGVRVERTAAFARAQLLGAAGADLDAMVARLGGVGEVAGDDVDVPEPGQPPRDWPAYREAARADAKALLPQLKAARAGAGSRSVRSELRTTVRRGRRRLGRLRPAARSAGEPAAGEPAAGEVVTERGDT